MLDTWEKTGDRGHHHAGREPARGCSGQAAEAVGEHDLAGGTGGGAHPEDDVFYVLAGTMSVLVGAEWIEATTGSFVVAF
jgi:hypothetical protein